jgi:hypothetical protein
LSHTVKRWSLALEKSELTLHETVCKYNAVEIENKVKRKVSILAKIKSAVGKFTGKVKGLIGKGEKV